MTFAQAEQVPFNPFDVTKVWPQGDFPLIPVGKMVLDRNPTNYFTEVEMIAFSPAHFVPGIDASPDKMLQGRLFSYSDTHRHRLGPNYLQLPVNCPFRVRNYQRDGFMCYENQGQSLFQNQQATLSGSLNRIEIDRRSPQLPPKQLRWTCRRAPR